MSAASNWRPAPRGAGGWIVSWSVMSLLATGVGRAADVSVLGAGWSQSAGVAQLQAGAGTEFNSPIASEVHIAFLSITNTGGASWVLRIAREDLASTWPDGVNIFLRRGGGSAEAGISSGLGYVALTDDLQAFFSGTGDYETVEILARLDGISTSTAPGVYSLKIRYAVEVP